MRFKIDWASLIVVKYKSPERSYLEGRFNGGFLCVTGLGGLYLEGLIHGGACFRNFIVIKFSHHHDEVNKKLIENIY